MDLDRPAVGSRPACSGGRRRRTGSLLPAGRSRVGRDYGRAYQESNHPGRIEFQHVILFGPCAARQHGGRAAPEPASELVHGGRGGGHRLRPAERSRERFSRPRTGTSTTSGPAGGITATWRGRAATSSWGGKSQPVSPRSMPWAGSVEAGRSSRPEEPIPGPEWPAKTASAWAGGRGESAPEPRCA